MTHQLLLTWFLVYAIPALAAFGVTKWFNRRDVAKKYQLVVIHVALLISVLLSQSALHFFGVVFPWRIDLFSVLALVVGTSFSFFVTGPVGLWYAVSAFIQQAVMLSIAFLLLPVFSVYVVILLIVPIFVMGHLLSLNHVWLRTTLLSIWGSVALLLFAETHNLYGIAALHAILGSFVISRLRLWFGKNHSQKIQGWLG